MLEARADYILKSLVETPSVYPNEQKIGRVYEDILDNMGFNIISQDIGGGRRNLLASSGKKGQSILFYGHQDTVPLTKQGEWATDPFILTRLNDRFYGLGTSDMKGGVAAFLAAAEEIDFDLKIFLAVDEENISEGAWHALQNTPEFFDDLDLIVSAESSFDLPLSGVTRGRTGRSVFQIDFEGKPEHIIRYKYGVDAIEKAGNFIYKLYRDRESIFNSPDTVSQVRQVFGESVGMSVAASSQAEVEVLVGHPDTDQTILEALGKLTTDKIFLKPRKTPYLPAYFFETFPYQEIIAEIIKKNTGSEMTLHTRKSVGDDNVLATLGIPVITWGPNGGNEHRTDEYIEIDSFHKITRMYRDLLRSLK